MVFLCSKREASFLTHVEKSADKSEKKSGNDVPMYLKDYERKLVLQRNGDISDVEEQQEFEPGYCDLQEKNKQQFKASISALSSVIDEDGDELLKKRIKSSTDVSREEDEYYDWLKGQKTDDDLPEAKELKGLRDIWNDSSLQEDEKFLRDYLMNKNYEVDDEEGIPTYEEIVEIEKDEEEMKRGSEFESKYNFRYEEPDQEFIKQYPRTIMQSLRKKNEHRKDIRNARKERKQVEKTKRKEEIRELKTLKKREIEAKLEKLKKLAGDENLSLNIDDLEADFDPSQYDERMKEVFNQEYYDNIGAEEDEKPTFSDLSDATEDSDYDNFDIKEERENAVVAVGSSDNHFDGMYENRKKLSRRKRKRNSKFLETLLKKKPLFDPNEKTFEEYFNEYYALNYEDIISDGLVTKFKYRSVPANDFGLSADEILNADDRQLNAWASLKKVTAYRSEAEEFYDSKAYKEKASNVLKKKRIFSTDFGGKKSMQLEKTQNSDYEKTNRSMKSSVDSVRKSGKVQNNKSQKFSANSSSISDKIELTTKSSAKNEMSGIKEIKKVKTARRRKKKQVERFTDFKLPIDENRLRAYGVNPKKLKNKLFHKMKNSEKKVTDFHEQISKKNS